jgi:hypothetical protein
MFGLPVRLLFWVLLCSALYLSSCQADLDAPRAQPDAGSADALAVPDATPPRFAAPDASPPATLDAGSTDLWIMPSDARSLPDTRVVADALPCEKIKPGSNVGVLPILLPTAAYCFELCPEARDPVDPLSYAWSCVGSVDTRAIAVNGVPVSCVGQAARSSGSVLPATVNGVWAFTLSAGGHTNDFINWVGALRACP